jgi:MFS family permease
MGLFQVYKLILAINIALVPIGAGFGAFLTGPILTKFSRRDSMILTDIISILGVALSLVPKLYVLFIARFIIGLGVGLNSALV